MVELEYQRMWENKGHRPYWAQLHVLALSSPFEKLTGFCYKKHIFAINKDCVNAAYFDVNEMKEAAHYFKAWWSNKQNVENYFKKLKQHFIDAQDIVEKTFHLDWQKFSPQGIVIHIKKLESMHGFSYLFYTQPQHVEHFEIRLKEMVSGKENPEQIITAVTRNNLPLPFDKEREEIAAYRIKWYTLSSQEKQRILDLLVKKYSYLSSIEGEAPYNHAHYEKEILSISEERHHTQKEIGVDNEIKELGQLIAQLSNQRIWCRWHGMRLRYAIKLSLLELGKRWNISDIEYATLPEIYEFTKTGKLNREEMKRRKELGYVAIILEGNALLFTGEKALPYLEKIKENILKTSEIHGKCANPGKITGKVRIISFASDIYHQEINSFQKGEILVTGMTRPQIAHLCHKASAIITDEGGITSHASIISREYNIPCVIATHNATKILKTGDIVEVDATKGTVKKISS